MPIRGILVATDGSPTAQVAEAAARRIARAAGASLLFVSAYGEGGEERAREAVESARKRAEDAGVEAAVEVAEGEPAPVITEQADRADSDLIVVGDIGMGQARRLRLGGVPDRVSHTAPCSLLIVRTAGSGSGADQPPGAYRDVLVATDGSPTADHAARVGAELAMALEAQLSLVHVGDELLGKVVLRDTAERLGDEAAPQLLESGDPARAIVGIAKGRGFGLVVVGNKGMAGAARALGSVPNAVSHDAPCDVLIVQTVGRSLADLEPGEGAVVDLGGDKVAG
jgi:nucleotide-binding universal stress UspA family protein